jgi:hypothetical protein
MRIGPTVGDGQDDGDDASDQSGETIHGTLLFDGCQCPRV